MSTQENNISKLDVLLAESTLLAKLAKASSAEEFIKLIDNEMERINKEIAIIKSTIEHE